MDRGLDEFKPENIKECDQKMLSIIKGKAQELFDEQKRKCGEYGYRLEKCKVSQTNRSLVFYAYCDPFSYFITYLKHSFKIIFSHYFLTKKLISKFIL
jgi:hypothetical protein